MDNEDLQRAQGIDAQLDWQRLESRHDENANLMLFEKRIDTMKNPRNQRTFERLALESVDWVNVVALTHDRESVMIRQYRFGVGYTTLETPGGMVDAGEHSGEAAVRELYEETGYRSEKWTYLGAVEPNPAIFDNLCHHWLAEDVCLAGDQDLGAGESIRVTLMNETEVRKSVLEGELRHALALSALSRVFELWPRPFTQSTRGESHHNHKK